MFVQGEEGVDEGVVERGQAWALRWVSHDSFCHLMDGGIWGELLKGACGASL